MSSEYVVHCKKASYDVYIGRPGPWGNPFELGRESDRAEVISKYRFMVARDPERVAKIKRELRGKVLGCYCAPKACHGDVLAKIANG